MFYSTCAVGCLEFIDDRLAPDFNLCISNRFTNVKELTFMGLSPQELQPSKTLLHIQPKRTVQ